MTAAALARFVPVGTRITLIESDAIGTVGVGEATIPGIRLFNQMLGTDEAAFLRETNGSFKLGIRFEGWLGEGSGYLHAFGSIGRALGLVPFHHYWLRGGGAANPASLWTHMASAQAAMAGRFAPDPGRPDLPSGLAWAYHFDASLYAALLRRHAEAAGWCGSREGSPLSRETRAGGSTMSCWKAAKPIRATCSSTAPASARC